jgi:DNA-binding SARP family transcriptional activator/class 3 adenylate cyclase
MEFAVLGPLQVRGDEGALSLGGPKQRALLALLLLEPNRVVPRERLIDGLWGDEPPETAAQTVQVYVSRLRKLLPAETLVTRSPGYVLELDAQQVDAHRFARLAAEARSLPPAQAAPLLREALELWRGPALAEFAAEPALHAEGARLEEARLAAREQLLEADLALGRHAEVVGELDALVRAHPLRESLRALQMLALYRAGRQAEALASYQDARAALVDELGLDPSPSLQKLEQAILQHHPSLELVLPAEPVEPPAAPTTSVRIAPARKTVTVMVCEAAASTVDGSRPDSDVLRLVMSRYFEAAAAVLRRHEGQIERFENDAVVSVFGLPRVHEDDAIRALRAAAELRAGVAELNRSLELDFRSTLDLRIGVDTGEVLTGIDERPTTGDVLTSVVRVQQGAARGEIAIAAETLALVRDTVEVEEHRPGVYRVTSFEPWAPRPFRRLDAPMVGRANELERIRAVFATAAERSTCVRCTVLGPAGVGKSRLARELVEGIDAQVVEGRCLPYGEGITYSAIVDVVTQLAGGYRELLAATPAAAATIASLLGESRESTAAEEVAWAVRKLLEASAHTKPLVVVFDDVQWGEPGFVELVEHVVYLSTGVPILLLCLARPELLDRHPSWGAARGDSTTVLLEPLAPEEIDELIDHLLQGEQLEHDLGARIKYAAQGNPLFVEEMLAIVREAGGDEVLVPPTIKALLAARLDQLEPGERELLGCGSIEGELFHRGAVEAMLAETGALERELVALARKELVRPDRSPFLRDDAFRFHHLLIRDAAYDALPKATRAELHERFAAWLADHSDQIAERDELLGYHLEQAHDYRAELGSPDRALGERAAAHLVAAGARAAALSDVEAVASLLRRALSLGIADPRDRVRAQLELGQALHQTRRVAESEAVLTETHELAARLGEDDVAALALVQRVWNRTGVARTSYEEETATQEEAQIVAEQAIDVLDRTGDERGLALARRLRGMAIGWRSGFTATVEAELEHALVHARASGDRETLRLTISSLTNAYLVDGPTPAAAAIDRCEQLLDSVQDDRVLEATVQRPLALFHAMTERPAEAIRLLDEAGDVLDDLSLRTAQVYRWVGAYARELAGDIAGAESELTAIWAYFRDLRPGQIDTRARVATTELARMYCDLRRWDDADATLEYGRSASAVQPSRLLAVEARLAAHQGSPVALARAREAVAKSEHRAPALTTGAIVQAALAEVERTTGRSVEADASFERAIELYALKQNLAAAAALRSG